jgi:hypothetical protein
MQVQPDSKSVSGCVLSKTRVNPLEQATWPCLFSKLHLETWVNPASRGPYASGWPKLVAPPTWDKSHPKRRCELAPNNLWEKENFPTLSNPFQLPANRVQ